jgi:hypothetical protein
LLDHLPRLRAAADAGVLSPAAAFQAYSKIMDALFDVDSSSYQGNELVVDHQTDASIDAARALEYASREAALVDGAAAAHGQMSASDRELFASAVADQRLLIGDALGTFSAQLRGPWARAYDSRAHRQFMVLENRIAGSIGSRAPIPVNIRTWQTVSRKFQAGWRKRRSGRPRRWPRWAPGPVTGCCSKRCWPAASAWWRWWRRSC